MNDTVPCWHDDVIKWKHFPRYWPFVLGIHRSPVNSPHKGQWRGALILSLIFDWINSWVNNREAGDLRHHRTHYDVIVTDKKSTSIPVMAWCRQVSSHYLSLCSPRFMSPYGVASPQWLKGLAPARGPVYDLNSWSCFNPAVISCLYDPVRLIVWSLNSHK